MNNITPIGTKLMSDKTAAAIIDAEVERDIELDLPVKSVADYWAMHLGIIAGVDFGNDHTT